MGATIVEVVLWQPQAIPDVVLGRGTKGEGVLRSWRRGECLGSLGVATLFFFPFLLFPLVHPLILRFGMLHELLWTWWRPEDA